MLYFNNLISEIKKVYGSIDGFSKIIDLSRPTIYDLKFADVISKRTKDRFEAAGFKLEKDSFIFIEENANILTEISTYFDLFLRKKQEKDLKKLEFKLKRLKTNVQKQIVNKLIMKYKDDLTSYEYTSLKNSLRNKQSYFDEDDEKEIALMPITQQHLLVLKYIFLFFDSLEKFAEENKVDKTHIFKNLASLELKTEFIQLLAKSGMNINQLYNYQENISLSVSKNRLQ